MIKFMTLLMVSFFLEWALMAPGWRESFFPRPSVLFVFFAAMQWGQAAGAITGFTIGFIHAAMFGEPAGLLALALALTGYLMGGTSFYLRESPRPVLFIFALIFLGFADLLASLMMTLCVAPFFTLRFGSALTGGLVFALTFPGLERMFRAKKRQWRKKWI
ncbi:MAG: rod shape-determining protein MreD [Candidatus Sumerlaeota bacterium]|nr:rod shape-determining protein MreD [Candidatus Sumerlaeota bacterium]